MWICGSLFWGVYVCGYKTMFTRDHIPGYPWVSLRDSPQIGWGCDDFPQVFAKELGQEKMISLVIYSYIFYFISMLLVSYCHVSPIVSVWLVCCIAGFSYINWREFKDYTVGCSIGVHIYVYTIIYIYTHTPFISP